MGYLRLLRRLGEMLYTASEQSELLLLLTDSAGVSDAKIDGVHPKGGYRVNCTIVMEQFDNVMSNIELNGWMSAI